jgi:DNA-binding SARP family transcriptional activator
MEFRILGPVEVVDHGRLLALGPSKQRALLALLLLHVNEVVSSDRVIEDLWGERAPATAATAVHGYVSHLRKVLDAGNGGGQQQLVTRSPGYVLEVDPEQVDLKRFHFLAQRGKAELVAGDPEAAAATLAEALSLWRGPPLAEFSAAPFAVAEGLRLQELEVSTLEDRIDADLALGRHAELVGELEALTAEHPFRERLHAQLMLALYRSDRQAEALETYRMTRRRLVDELGIEPGSALQDLHQAILRHDKALAPAPSPAGEAAPTRPADTPRRRRRVLAAAVALVVALALGLTLALGGRDDPSMRLARNSVGFIDAYSGRLTRSFPVGRAPSALAVTDGSVWAANYRDQTVSHIGPPGQTGATIPVGGHPTGIAALGDTVWVWTLEGLLVPIDARYDTKGTLTSLAGDILVARGSVGERRSLGGRITAGGGFLWIAAPWTTVVRVDPQHPGEGRLPVIPDAGVEGSLAYRDGNVWVGGAHEAFPIAATTANPGSGVAVGVARDLAFGFGSLWVASGGQAHMGGIVQALRRVDPGSRLVQATISVGSEPVAVAVAGDSVWVASRTDRTVLRVDPAQNRVVQKITLGAAPTALAPGDGGVWVAVG